MALTIFTACDASVGKPMGPERSNAKSAKALCTKFGVAYDKELSEKAYYIAYWVAQSSVSCKVNTENEKRRVKILWRRYPSYRTAAWEEGYLSAKKAVCSPPDWNKSAQEVVRQ